MAITIKSVHITEMNENTWGRVYIQYQQNEIEYFIFKNWFYCDEKTYRGMGKLESAHSDFNNEEIGKHHSVYLWFPLEKWHVFLNHNDVLNGSADNLFLTLPKHKDKYGTPSVIIKRLLIELRANIGEPIENRTGWYQRYQNPDLVLSNIIVDSKHKIRLALYEIELVLEPMQKLVYLLYLNHLEGIKLKDIVSYKNEIIAIYNKISKSDDKDKIAKRIDELTDISKNSLHEKISKINKIIADELGAKLAPFYQIAGSSGLAYKINLSSELITIKNNIKH